MVACPEDRDRVAWGLDPRGYDQGLYVPNYGVGPAFWRWPYSSSYWVTESVFDKNPAGMRPDPATYASLFINPLSKFGGRRISDIAYPAQKVYMYEQYGRHVTKFAYTQFYAFPTAKPVVQMFDNSCSIRQTDGANLGCNPNSGVAVQVPYNPLPGTPDPMPPAGTMTYLYYQYTKAGLQGRDFVGQENPNFRSY
jgi:hypothetical protein